METRFAGSGRLGDRRRRRLAIEADDATAPESCSLPAPQGKTRVADQVPPDPPRAAPVLPLDLLVPVPSWKYLLGGLAGLVLAAAILAAGWYESLLSATLGPSLGSLIGLDGASVARWYSGLLLSASAQWSLLIWWGRSRSHTDYNGQYRVWKRVALAWLMFGFCTVTGAERVWSEALLACWNPAVPGIDLLVWLVPATGVGIGLLWTLHCEMRDCRSSRTALYAASGCYLLAACGQIEIPLSLEPRQLSLLRAALPLVGHVALFLSMWLHARHVLHCTADPGVAPRRRLRIPRPHFSLWRRTKSEESVRLPTEQPPALPEDAPASSTGTKRRSKKGDLSQDAAPLPQTPTKVPEETPRSTARSRLRIDSPHPTSREKPDSNDEDSPAESGAPSGSARPSASTKPPAERKQPPAKTVVPPPPFDDAEPLTLPQKPSNPLPATPSKEVSAAIPAVATSTEISREESSAVSAPAATDDEESGWNEPFPKPDLRGLSKKQRRRLMQELREKHRATRGE
ncbi:MAG: hypothetical protein ACKV0T_09250 [Planctomycetales bacterium]